MKPIEPGCRAVIVGHPHEPNNGMIVRVLTHLGCIPPATLLYFIGDRWQIDSKITYVVNETNDPHGMVDHVQGKYLRRIDEYDGDKAGSWGELSDIFVPELIAVTQPKGEKDEV